MKKRHFIKYGLPVLILALGFIGMRALVLSKTPPQKQDRPQIGTLVETMDLHAVDQPVMIHVTGTVQPSMSIHIIPQVSGRVVQLAHGFQEGGFFTKGQLLFAIEDTDYRLAAEKSRAQIARSEYELASVESQARVARLEWKRVKLEDKTQPNPLVLHEPQLKNAKTALAGAKADLEQRLLDMERTRIYAPFNCRVGSKSVDPGQYVTVGQAVATVVGTDMADIIVPVPLEELQWLDIPRKTSNMGKASKTGKSAHTGSAATVRIDGGGTIYTWEGWIDRSLGEVDTQSRMVRLAVQVEDPYGLKESDAHPFSLADGLFVDVTLTGRMLKQVFSIPASALRYQDTIWIMTGDKTLEIRPVQVLRREKENVLVRGDVKSGQRLVVTHLTGVSQGMRLRLAGEVQS